MTSTTVTGNNAVQGADTRYLDDVQDAAYARSRLHGDAAVEAESRLLVAFVAAELVAVDASERTPDMLSLSGDWLMRSSAPRSEAERHVGWPWQPLESPAVEQGWYRPDVDRSDWHTVHVPTSVQTALIKLGELDDPFWDANTYTELEQHGTPLESPWFFRKTRIEQQEWWFAKRFDLPAAYEGRALRLYFDGVDYAASFYLNGFSFGYHAGMFGGPTLDITDVARFDGPNELVVRIYPPPATWFNIPKGSPGWGWHYGHLISSGIWRDVQVQAVPHIELRDPFVTTSKVETNQATLEIEYTIDNHEPHPTTLAVVGTISGATFATEPVSFSSAVDVLPGTHRYRTEVPIAEPRLWWPLGYGNQDRYILHLAVLPDGTANGGPLDAKRTEFGIRTIEMRAAAGQAPDVDYRWQFVVNGVPLFIKGANWCWLDPMMEGDRERYERILELARRGNIQMFRAWGGGIVETDDFYRMCDEKGLLVYQEFPYCWGPWDAPLTDLGVLDRQVTQVVKRLRNHPSLIMWGGGNENGAPTGVDEALFLVGRRCRQFDPSRPYHRTDPWGGSQHNYHVFHRGEPIDTGYRNLPTVFYGEWGTPSMTNRSSTLRYLPEEALSTWPPDATDYGVIAHLNQFSVRDLIKQLRYADYGPVRDWNTYTEYSQMAQGDALRFVAEIQRAGSTNDKTGFWFYKFTDLFPGHAWAVVDWYGEPKLSYYRAKQACQPQAAFATYPRLNWSAGEQFTATIHVANDTPEPLRAATVQAVLFGSDLDALWDESFTVDEVDANGCVDLASMEVVLDGEHIEPLILAVAMHDISGNLISDRWYWFNYQAKTDAVRALEALPTWDFPEERAAEAFAAYAAVPEARLLKLPPTTLQVRTEHDGRQGTLIVENIGERPAINVLIDDFPDGYGNFLADNSFGLHPGETRRIAWELGEGMTLDGVTVRAWNAPRVLIGIS